MDLFRNFRDLSRSGLGHELAWAHKTARSTFQIDLTVWIVLLTTFQADLTVQIDF